MALTRIRAAQISDIDYKQSCRVLANSNVALSGGTPLVVDGKTLNARDRVLVIGQTSRAQNGIYVVQTPGTGENGTWARSRDGDVTGEIQAGMIVMVTEGDVYKDTQWKLITNDPIVLNITELDFELNSAFAFGNITANGTSVIANTVGDAVTFDAGTDITLTANAQSQTITFSSTALGNRGTDPNDWNSLTSLGIYKVNRESWSGTTGTPTDSMVFVGILQVMTSVDATVQIFYPGTIGEDANNVRIQWNRSLWSGSWTAWYKIVNDSQVVDAGSF